ncbi:hypothetical protein, partial [Promineifilum sp.]|uniref:hypothetical protein n=1 Tax=Promineifilum sp. TaxID=2664178 RepID=UPI0035B21AFB
HWHWATPLWYLQGVEGQRPDVDVRFVFPEGEPYDATWARRTTEAFAEGRPVITTWVPTAPLADLPVPEPVGEALLYPQTPRVALPPDFTPAQIALGGEVEIVGYRVEQPAGGPLAPGEEFVLLAAWRPLGEPPATLSLFLHLAGPDGALYGQSDRTTVAAEGITLTQFRLTPRPGTPTGPLTLYIGAAGEAIGRERLAEVTIGSSPVRPYTAHQTQRRLLEGGDTLVGYDWDHTLADRQRLYLHWRDAAGGYRTQVVDDTAVDSLALPPYRGPWGAPATRWDFSRGRDGGHYVPFGEGIVWTGETVNGVVAAAGETFTLDQEFHSARPINRDYVVSARLIGLEPDGFHWAWWDLQDSIPALGAIPTLKWVEGSFVRSPHRVTVSPDAPPGQTLTGALTLYDAFTNRPLPILDERITADYAWVPLCQGQVK